MTLDPRHLHALAELWSLTAAWPHLQRAVRAAEAAGADDADRGTLRSPTYGSGLSGGGGFARSAILDAVAERPAGPHPVLRAAEQVTKGVEWVATIVRARRPEVPATLRALIERVPELTPTTAEGVGRHIADADRLARRWAGLDSDGQRLTGVRCPACGVRAVEVRTSCPDVDARPYVCGAGCACKGEDCPCGMPVRVEGVQHIWLREQLVDAVRRMAT